MIEAAIIGRPVFSMLAEEFAGTQEGTIHFHHLLPENGGCVRIASTIDEHVRQLSDRLSDPGGGPRRDAAIHRQLHSAARSRSAGHAGVRRRHRAPGGRAGAAAAAGARLGLMPCALLLAAAVPGGIAGWVTRPDPFKWLRKCRRLYRTRKTASKRGRSRWIKPLRARRRSICDACATRP